MLTGISHIYPANVALNGFVPIHGFPIAFSHGILTFSFYLPPAPSDFHPNHTAPSSKLPPEASRLYFSLATLLAVPTISRYSACLLPFINPRVVIPVFLLDFSLAVAILVVPAPAVPFPFFHRQTSPPHFFFSCVQPFSCSMFFIL